MKKTKLFVEKASKGELTREKIIKAALKCFAKTGFNGTSIQEIANQVGLTQAGVLKHFGSKLGLFSAIFSQVLKDNYSIVESLQKPGTTGAQGLKFHCQGNLEWASQKPDQASVLLHLYYLASVDTDFFEFYQEVRAAGRTRVEKYLLEEKRLTTASDRLKKVSEVIHEALIGEVVNMTASREAKNKTLVERSKAKMDFLIDELMAAQV